jgi:hypothetical protein
MVTARRKVSFERPQRTTAIIILPLEQNKPLTNSVRWFTMVFQNHSLCTLLFFTILAANQINASWVVPEHCRIKSSFHPHAIRRITSRRFLVHHDSTVLPTLTVAVVESWRQYVPLAVSFAVITDILLGSPLANTLMAPLRPQSKKDTIDDKSKSNPKERIDTQALANAAIERARNTLELRRYLDENKTDWQKMEEIRKKMDQEMNELDAKLEERRKELE